MAQVRVSADVVGGRKVDLASERVTVPLAGKVTLWALIDAIVRQEVSAFKQRAEQEKLIRVLTDGELADALVTGAVRSGGRDMSVDVSPDDAVRTALQAHRDGLFVVVVDDNPVDDLDVFIDVSDETRVLFLRLVPLAGG